MELRRFYTYTDAEGVPWASVWRIGTPTNRSSEKQLMAAMIQDMSHAARVFKWSDVELTTAELPEDEIMRRANAVSDKKGEPHRFSDEQIAKVSKAVVTNIVLVHDSGAKQDATMTHTGPDVGMKITDTIESPLSVIENEMHGRMTSGILTPVAEPIIDPTAAEPIITLK